MAIINYIYLVATLNLQFVFLCTYQKTFQYLPSRKDIKINNVKYMHW